MGAFLDPDNWLEGSYDGVWELFESCASTEAQEQVETLTAGVGAGDAFEQILPEHGTLKTKVLFDQKEQAFSVVAITRFEAVGTGKDGDDVRMTSRGQFVFQQVDGEWRVVSFKVLRDNEVEASSVAGERDPVGEHRMNVRRRSIIAVTALVAWVAGSALGSLGAVAPASAQAGLVIGKAHAGFAPSLTGERADRAADRGERRATGR